VSDDLASWEGGWETKTKTVAGVSVAGVDGWTLDMVVTLPDNWGGLVNLDDGFTLDGDWSVDGVWLVDADLNWDLDDLLNWDWDVVWSSVWLLNRDWLVDGVDFSLGLDDWGVVGGGSLEGSWDGNVEVWDDGLHDSGVVSSNIGAGAQVDFLPDLCWWLVNGHSWGTGDVLGVPVSWESDGWSGNGDWSSSSNWGTIAQTQTVAQRMSGQRSHVVCWGGGGSGKHGRQDEQRIHGVGVYLLL